MDFSFPEGVYTDVRIEEVSKTEILLHQGKLEGYREPNYTAAFIRLFDGNRWYYASTTDLRRIPKEIDCLSKLCAKNPKISEHPLVRNFEVHRDNTLLFTKAANINSVTRQEKIDRLRSYDQIMDEKPYLLMRKSQYIDEYVKKTFISSKGSLITFDFQRAGIHIHFELADGERRLREFFQRGGTHFSQLENLDESLLFRYQQACTFLAKSEPIEPGKWTLVLSPEVSGIFAHESFGHKSESDFMAGDLGAQEAWKIGTKVGSEILTIIDSGQVHGSGYVPYDDEGTRSRFTTLIDKGVLSGRLHSVSTATMMDESLTGNARAVDFSYEPIVRMTTTYIKEGTQSLYDLISDIDDGILVESVHGGSGMSTFTMRPSLTWRIRRGTVAEPVRASVISGTVIETLQHIEGVSNRLEISGMVLGGCGKMEQSPLPVGFGGPYIRVRELMVQ